MPTRTKRIDPNALLIRIKRELRGEPDEIPENAKTTSDWARAWGLSDSQASSIIRRAVSAGIMVRLDLRLAGSARKVPHYAEVEK